MVAYTKEGMDKLLEIVGLDIAKKPLSTSNGWRPNSVNS